MQRVRSRSRGAKRSPGPGDEARTTILQLPKFNTKYQDYTLLRRGLDGDGVGLRRSMDLQDMDPRFCVYWGRKFRGRQVAEGWYELESGGYIPRDIRGTRLVVADQLRSPVGGKGHKGVAQSGGPAAEPWPPEEGGQRSSGKGKQNSERRAAPRKGKGGEEEAATAAEAPPVPRLRRGSRSGPPGQQEEVVSHLTAGPAAEEEAAVSQKILKKFFCKWDDAHFRDRVPALMPGGWQQLTNRQIIRLVGKWRKTQHVWKFKEQGGLQGLHLGPYAGEGVC